MAEFLFTQHKVAKGCIFTTAFQKDKSNPDKPATAIVFFELI